MPRGQRNPTVLRVCACGCESTFWTNGRRKCINREHMQTWRERRFEKYRQRYFADIRREKFLAMIRAALASGTVKESQLLKLCQECWRRGYDSGYQKMFKRVESGQAKAA